MSNTTPADSTARSQALDPTGSYAVTAPAGSGKTGLLTQRVLKLLPLCEHPEEILCITFTRKAAAEMQERITHAITQAAETPRPSDPHGQLTWDLAQAVLQRDKQQQWNLLSSPNRLRIQTIDGLCGALTRHNPLASQIGGQTQLLDQPEQAYRQAVINLLTNIESDSDEELQNDLSRLLEHLDNNQETVIQLLTSLLARRDQWLGHLLGKRHARPYLENVLAELVGECFTETSELLQPWASDMMLLADYAASNCAEEHIDTRILLCKGQTGLPTLDSTQLDLWLGITDFLLTQKGEWRSPRGLNKKCGFPAGTDKDSKALAKQRKQQMSELLAELQEQPKLLSQLQLIRYLPPAHYDPQQWRLLDSLTHLLPLLVAELKLVFKQLNATDFSEVTRAALISLGDSDSPTDLALALDYRINHILVDEFQDTASPQLQLLESLTRGWQQGDGRTLFIVGDGMQSCYGFRDANVGIFLDARGRGIGDVQLTPLDLTVNFRSQGGVIDWVNKTFALAFPDADDIARGAVRYANAIAFHPPMEGPAVSTHLFMDAENRDQEAELVCSLVKQSQAEQPDGTVAILVRNRGHLRDIIPALQASGLRWQATDIDPLASRMAIIDLLSLTRALLDPSDRIAWLSLLRSPWCGLDLSDLHLLAGRKPDADRAEFPFLLQRILDHGASSDKQLSENGQKCLERFARVIRSSWHQRRRKTLRQWISGAWLALGGPACLLDSADYDNCDAYFNLLDKYDQGGQIPQWLEFKRAVDQLYAAPDKQADARLQVMTIHKSKGLEFDTVIIPGLDKSSRADDNPLLLWQERIDKQGHNQLLLSTLSPTGQDNDPVYHYLKEEQKLKNRLEATRLLYVGCTRAIKRLYLLANAKSDPKTEAPKAPSSGSLLASFWRGLDMSELNCIPAASETKADISPKRDDDDSYLPYSLRLSADWQRPVLVPATTLAAYRGREFSDEENLVNIDSFRHRHARHIGTVIHRILQQIGNEGPQRWDNARIQHQLPIWQMQLRQQGFNGNTLQQASHQIELAIRKTLSDPQALWLLDPNHKESACELEIQYIAREPRLAIIDRTFVVSEKDQEQRWIVDYKSSEPAAGQSLEAFLQQEVAEYQPQLQRYADLFRQREDRQIKLALYFPLLQHLQDVEYLNKL